MPQMLTMRLWSLFILLTPFALLALKYVQIGAEKRVRGSSAGAPISELLSRRLDDPSLWAMFASALAALLVVHGIQKIGAQPELWANPSAVKRFRLWGWNVLGGLAGVYLIITFLKKEALFFTLGNGPDQRDGIMLTVQFIEGVINLTVICVMARTFTVALIGLDEIRTRAQAGVPTQVLASAGRTDARFSRYTPDLGISASTPLLSSVDVGVRRRTGLHSSLAPVARGIAFDPSVSYPLRHRRHKRTYSPS
ncbi:MAG: hypothetical protein SGJ19_05250 [Planctomycetia bacterium]|nr:hypothetical protein [Planctomycetia bacterium]